MEHAPVWVLRYELKNKGPRQLPALLELQARLDRHQLKLSQVAAIADRCLSVQADRSVPWVAAWGNFLESARSSHLLDDARWSTYAMQAPDLSIVARPAAVAGDNISVEPMLKSSRLSKACFIAYVMIQSATLDGKPVSTEDLRSIRMSINDQRISLKPEGFEEDARFAVPGQYSNQSLGGIGHSIDRDLSATLAVGAHTLSVDCTFYMVESNPKYGYKPVNGDPTLTTPEDVPLEKTKPVGSKTFQASCTFTIYRADQMPDLMTVADLNHAVGMCMQFRAVAEKSGGTALHWMIKDFPGRLDFRIYVRRPDGKLEEPKAMLHPMYGAGPGLWVSDDDQLSSEFDHVAKLDVILRPDVRKSRESGVALTKTWADDIVLKDIRVQRK